MAKSRGRKFAELVAPTNGVFAAASIPTIALSKLAASTFSVNSESASLGGNVVLDSNDVTEHTNAKYFTNARAQATLSVAANSGHGALSYDNSNGQFTFAGITTEAIQDVVGAMFSSNTETAVTVSYQDSDGTIDLVVDDTTKVPLAGGTMTGNLTLNDNVKAYFGSDTDLQIYHTGTNGFIVNSTGELRFSGSDFAIKSDSAKLLLGADDDLRIYYDGNHSYMTNTGGSLYIRSTNSIQLETNGGVDMLTLGVGGAATLYHNGSAKLATTSTGIDITGSISTDGLVSTVGITVDHTDGTDNISLTPTSTGGVVNVRNSSGTSVIALDGRNSQATIAGFASMATGAATSKFAVGTSGVHGSYDFYNNGTSYFNGAVIVDDNLNANSLTVNSAYSFPTSDGTNGQVLQTDGSGNLTFATGGGGSGDITAVVAGTNLTGGATSGSATVNLATNLSGLGTISSGPITVTTGANEALLVTGGPSSLHQKIYNTSTTGTYSYLQLTTVNSSSAQNHGYLIKNAGQNTGNSLGNNSLYLWNQTNEIELVPAGTIANRITLGTSGDLTVRGAGATNSTGTLGEAFSDYFGLKHISQSKGSEYMILSRNDHTYVSATSGYDVIIRNGGNNSTNQLVVGSGATDLTWRGSTVWTAENDGASSGLFSQYTNTLVGTGGISNAVDTSHVEYSGQLSASVSGLFNASNNANGILRLNTHPGNYYHDLGFSSDGNMYHRNFSNSNAFTTAAWYKVWDASNDGTGSGLDADLLDGQQGSYYMASTGMATNLDTYVNLRVVRNSGSSAGSDGMYIGYGNAGNGDTRIYGGGSTSAYIAHTGGNLAFTNTTLGTVSMAGTLTSRDILFSSGYHLQRSDHHSGHLEGSYNNIGPNSTKTNPIYTIGSSYNPGETGLSNMYGIGYSHPNASFIQNTGASGWGLYVAADGDARVWLDASAGVISSTGHHYVGSNVVWNAGNDGPGTGLDADTVDGQQASEMTWGHDVAHGTYTNFNSFINTALFGAHFVQATTNGPGHSGATQYYHQRMSLGSNYNNYSLQFAIPRNRSDSYLYYRNEENGSASSWYKMKAGDSDTLAGLSAKGVGSATGASQVLTSNTNNYFVHRSWIDVGTGGIYSATNGAHLTPNTSTSYASWRSVGSRGGFDGIMFDSGGDVAVMFDAGGNGGFYRQASSRWYNYHHLGNNSTAFGSSTTSSSYQIYCHGAIYATGNIVAYSDRRIKENIVPIDNALEKVNKLAGVYYNRIEDEKKTREIGFIAQDVNEVAPELVTYAEDVDQYGVKYGNTTALLVEAVKELTQQVKDLKQELEELKNG